MKQAIGMIETQGLIGLIEATDTMFKSSNVHLLGYSRVGGGINTVMIEGNVAAVETAIQSAKASVNLLGNNLLLSEHVIPRPKIIPDVFVTNKQEKPNVTDEHQTPAAEQPNVDQKIENKAATKEQPKISKEKVEKRTAMAHAQQSEKEFDETPTASEEIQKIAKADLKQEAKISSEKADSSMTRPENKEQLQEKLQQMKVSELRNLLEEQKDFSRSKKEIYQMGKTKLIQALIDSLIIKE